MQITDHGRRCKVVYDQNRQAVGFLLGRGPAGVEAFNADERSLGTFTDEHAAAVAVFANVAGAP